MIKFWMRIRIRIATLVRHGGGMQYPSASSLYMLCTYSMEATR